MKDLYHYTCQHGRDTLGDTAVLLPPREIHNAHGGPQRLHGVYAELDGLVWMTDLDCPVREGLGLTSNFVTCDRSEFRYRVVDPAPVTRWVAVRRGLNRTLVQLLEGAPGAMPMHWWVSRVPVPVVFDPIRAGVA